MIWKIKFFKASSISFTISKISKVQKNSWKFSSLINNKIYVLKSENKCGKTDKENSVVCYVFFIYIYISRFYVFLITKGHLNCSLLDEISSSQRYIVSGLCCDNAAISIMDFQIAVT